MPIGHRKGAPRKPVKPKITVSEMKAISELEQIETRQRAIKKQYNALLPKLGHASIAKARKRNELPRLKLQAQLRDLGDEFDKLDIRATRLLARIVAMQQKRKA